MNKTWPLPEI